MFTGLYRVLSDPEPCGFFCSVPKLTRSLSDSPLGSAGLSCDVTETERQTVKSEVEEVKRGLIGFMIISQIIRP